jgi:hypothetical protein
MEEAKVKQNNIGTYIYRLVALSAWVIGVVLAQGFWQTFFSILLFPYAWYLTAEKFLHYFGVI